MKKLFPIAALTFSSLFIFSCDNGNDEVAVVDNTVYAQVKDVTGTFSSSNGYKLTQGLSISNTTVVLVYRNVGASNNPIWQLIPKTFYLDDNLAFPANRELDYNFDFTTGDVEIRTEANFDQATQMTNVETSSFLVNQTFRIVLIPGIAGKTSNPVNHDDYNAVIKYYNINDSNVTKTKLN